jgi:hypothetical protein
LQALARRTADLVSVIEAGKAHDDADVDHRIQAAELFRRRGLI